MPTSHATLPLTPPARTTPAQRAAYVDVFRRSDLSAATFCREYGLTPATFARWRRTAPRSRRARPAPFARVVLADLCRAPAVATLRVVIRGVQGEAENITGVDARTVRRLVRVVLEAAGMR